MFPVPTAGPTAVGTVGMFPVLASPCPALGCDLPAAPGTDLRAPGLCRAGSGLRWKTKQDTSCIWDRTQLICCPGSSWLSPLESTLGQGTDPSQTCWGQQLSPCLEKPHLGHPKPIFCSAGSCSACSCPAPALCSTARAGLRLPSPGKSMVVSSSGDSSKLRMDCWKVLLQLDCKWL